MNIGIDIDDTIVNTYKNFVAVISMKYGLNYKKILSQNLSYLELEKNLKDYNLVKKDLFYILAKSVDLKKDVVEIIKKLKSEGHKIIFITARNYSEYDDPYKITYDYLIKNDIPFDKLIVNALNKDIISKEEKIDIFIDDSLKHCKSVNDCGIKTLQYKTLFTPILKDVLVVSNWDEIYNIIKGMVV